MENIKVQGEFVDFSDKSGKAKKTGEPYRICTLRLLIGKNVFDFAINPDKVSVKPLEGLKEQVPVTLDCELVPSNEGGFKALEPRLRVVGVKVK